MATENLKNALHQYFNERGIQVLTEEVDKLIGDWNDSLRQDPNCDICHERLAVLSALRMVLE